MRPLLSFQDMIYCGEKFIASTFENPQFNETLRDLVNQGKSHISLNTKKGIVVEADWYALQGCDGGLIISAQDYLVLQGAPTLEDVPYTSGSSGNDKSPNDYCETRTKFPIYYGKKTHQLTEGFIFLILKKFQAWRMDYQPLMWSFQKTS
jgi:hypothetical protein